MKLILFDWNGTLLDDITVWYDAVQEIFRRFGKEAPTIEQYFRELEGDYLTIYTSRGIEATRDELNEIYEPYYQEHVNSARLVPAVRKILQELKRRGYAIWLVSGQQEQLVSPLLKKFRISSYFDGGRFHVMNKTEVIGEILKTEDISPKDCCLVGDAPSDIRHANKAGITSVAFLGGYIPKELIIAAEPDHTIEQLQDITNLFE